MSKIEVTDAMLNAGQERLCEIRNGTFFDDEAQAAIYLAMRELNKPDVEAMRALRVFASTVHEAEPDVCPWCFSREHWAGRVGLCSAPSSVAIAEAIRRAALGDQDHGR